METSALNNNIKVPEPNVVNSTSKNTASESKDIQKRKAPLRQYNRPNVGVLNVPDISKTPLTDTFIKKRQDNPQMKYKFKSNTNYQQGLKPNAIVSIGILLAGIMAIFHKAK